MDTVGPPTTTLLTAYIVPLAVWLVWMAALSGLPLKAHSVSFCLHKMALALVVLLDVARIGQLGSPSGTSRFIARGDPADGGSWSCATERGICFTLCAFHFLGRLPM